MHVDNPMTRPNGRHTDTRSLGDLLRELTGETRTLVRQEIGLAQTEISEKVSEAGKDAASMGAGGAIAYAGFIVLAFGLALLLGTVMANWLAFVITGAAIAIIGYVMLQGGLTALKKANFSLQRTENTLREDKKWIKEEMTDGDKAPRKSSGTSTARGRR